MAKEKAVCKTCGKEFLYYRSTLRGQDGKYCSRKCIQFKMNSGSFKNQDKLKIGKCIGCGKEFTFYPSKYHKGIYCSQKCFQKLNDPAKHLPKDRSGSKNPSWKGGITPQTMKDRKRFVFSIGREVMKRDNYTCQICHQRGGKLQVDHIQPWAEYVEGRFDINNCRTLCQSCHYEITWGKPMPENSKWGICHRMEAIA